MGKESACNAGDTGDEGSIPGSGRSPGGGHGNPLQYSCWRIPRTEQPGRLQSIGSQKSWTRLKQLSTHVKFKNKIKFKKKKKKKTNLAYCSFPHFISWQLHLFNCSGVKLQNDPWLLSHPIFKTYSESNHVLPPSLLPPWSKLVWAIIVSCWDCFNSLLNGLLVSIPIVYYQESKWSSQI